MNTGALHIGHTASCSSYLPDVKERDPFDRPLVTGVLVLTNYICTYIDIYIYVRTGKKYTRGSGLGIMGAPKTALNTVVL